MRLLSAVAIFGLICSSLFASEQAVRHPRVFHLQATNAPIQIDGVLNESVWQKPPTFTLDYETYPGDNTTPPVRTEVWITYDHSHLYMAARAQDPKPELIRARLTDRDKAFQDDFVGIVLD